MTHWGTGADVVGESSGEVGESSDEIRCQLVSAALPLTVAV